MSACSKHVEQSVVRTSGLLPDDPLKTAKIPLIQSSSNVKFASRGKPPKGDRANPSVTIHSPAPGEVSGIVRVTGTATDNIGVISVSLVINGKFYAANSIVDFNWDTRALPDDAYQLTVVAYDGYGNTGSASVTVTKNTVVTNPPDTVISNGYIMSTPPVADQGSEGSCVAFSVGYAARSIDWYYKTQAASYSTAVNIFSPEFLYNQIKFSSECTSGSSMQMALDFVQANGICTYQLMPYSSSNGCASLPSIEQRTEAALYKIGGYVKMYTTDAIAIKTMLSTNKAVIVSLMTDNQFTNARTDFLWNSSTEYTIAHSVILCGYDDNLKAYRIMNSYGTGWGGAGFCWIGYEFFLTRTGTYCYAIK